MDSLEELETKVFAIDSDVKVKTEMVEDEEEPVMPDIINSGEGAILTPSFQNENFGSPSQSSDNDLYHKRRILECPGLSCSRDLEAFKRPKHSKNTSCGDMEFNNYNNLPSYYQCPECPYSSRQQLHFKKHFKKHLAKVGAKCAHCSFRMTNKSRIRSHEKIHEKKIPLLECPSCSLIFYLKIHLEEHMLLKHKISPIFNTQYSTDYAVELKRESPSPLEDNVEDRNKNLSKSQTQESVDLHKFSEKPRGNECIVDFSSAAYIFYDTYGIKWFKCTSEGCPFKTESNVSLKRHWTNHISNGPLKCLYCSFSCKNQEMLTSHLLEHVSAQSDPCKSLIKTEQEEQKWLNCTVSECPYKTQDFYSLKRHRTYHDGKGALKCHYCSFRCRNPKPFKFHFRQHCRDRSYRNNHYQHEDSPFKDSKRKSNVMRFKKRKRKGVKKCSYCSFSGTVLEVNTHKSIHDKKDTNQFPAVSSETSDDDDVPLIILKTRLDAKNNLCMTTNNAWRNPQQTTKTVLECSSNDPDRESEDYIKPENLNSKCYNLSSQRNRQFKKAKNSRNNPLKGSPVIGNLDSRVESKTDKETCSVGQNSKLNGSNHRITITITASNGSIDNSSVETELVAEILKSLGASNQQKESSDISNGNDEKKLKTYYGSKEAKKSFLDSPVKKSVVTDILNSFHISNEEVNDCEKTTMKVHYQKDHRTYKNNRPIKAVTSDSLTPLNVSNAQDKPGNLGDGNTLENNFKTEGVIEKVLCDNAKRECCNELSSNNSINYQDEIDNPDVTTLFYFIDSHLKTEQELVQNLILLDNLKSLQILNKKEKVLEETENLKECDYQKSQRNSPEVTIVTSNILNVGKVPENPCDNKNSKKLNIHCCRNYVTNCSTENSKLNERDTLNTDKATTTLEGLKHFHAKGKYRRHCDLDKESKQIKIIKSMSQDAQVASIDKKCTTNVVNSGTAQTLNTDDEKRTGSDSNEKLIETIGNDDIRWPCISSKRSSLCDLKRTYSNLNKRKSVSTINSNKNGECDLYNNQSPVAPQSCNNGNFSKVNLIEVGQNKTNDFIDTTAINVSPKNLSRITKSVGGAMLQEACSSQELMKMSVGNPYDLVEEESNSRSKTMFSNLSEYNLDGDRDRHVENNKLNDECNQNPSIDYKEENVDDLSEKTTSCMNSLKYFYVMDTIIGKYCNINYESTENDIINYNNQASQKACCTDGQLTELIVLSNLSENDEINQTLNKDDKKESASCDNQKLVNTMVNDDIHNKKSTLSSLKRTYSKLNESKSLSSGNISTIEMKDNMSTKQKEFNSGSISSKDGSPPKVNVISDLNLHTNVNRRLKIDACNKLNYSATKIFTPTNLESLEKAADQQASNSQELMKIEAGTPDLADQESKSDTCKEKGGNANNSNEDRSQLDRRLSRTELNSDDARYLLKQVDHRTFSEIDQQTNQELHPKENLHTPDNNASKDIDGVFKCTLCPFRIPRNKSFKLHVNMHLMTKGVECPLCTYRSNKTDLLKHLFCHVINLGGKFRCPLCETEKRTKENMSDHLKVGHSRAIFQKHDSSCSRRTGICNGCC